MNKMSDYNEMIDRYLNFMCNSENSHNCESCPENNNFNSWPGNRKPCGQFNCWVDLHTNFYTRKENS